MAHCIDFSQRQVTSGAKLQGVEVAFVVCDVLLAQVALQERTGLRAVDGRERFWEELAQPHELVES